MESIKKETLYKPLPVYNPMSEKQEVVAPVKGESPKNGKVPSSYAKVIINEGKETKEILIKKEAIFELSKRPYKVKENKKKISNGEICVCYLRENDTGDFLYVRPENGMFLVNGHYYHQNEACLHSIGPKRIPLAIIPEWSMVPFSRKAFGEGMGSEKQYAQKLIIKSIEHAEIVKMDKEINSGKGTNAKTLIIMVIVAIVGLALAQNYFGS